MVNIPNVCLVGLMVKLNNVLIFQFMRFSPFCVNWSLIDDISQTPCLIKWWKWTIIIASITISHAKLKRNVCFVQLFRQGNVYMSVFVCLCFCMCIWACICVCLFVCLCFVCVFVLFVLVYVYWNCFGLGTVIFEGRHSRSRSRFLLLSDLVFCYETIQTIFL